MKTIDVAAHRRTNDPAPGPRVGPEPDGLPGRRWPTAVRLFLAVVVMVVDTMAPALLGAVGDTWAARLPLAGQLAYRAVVSSLAIVSAILLVALLMRALDRRPFRYCGITLDRRALPALLATVAGTVALVLAVSGAVQATGVLRAGETLRQPLWFGLASGLVAAFVQQAIPEEFVFRGYVLQTLRTSPAAACLLSAAVFAVPHLASYGGQTTAMEHVVYLAVPFGFGLLAGAVVLRTRSVWGAVGVHGGFHTATLMATAWFHLGVGPALWLAQGTAMVLAAVLLMRRSGRQA